ncbi:hypothetical protein AVEN_215219-1 [Araneus ventricosus]|uniref:Uncharacterized protein n=1 Tax=Araneus ventricosus TaxID=182803 RepID=A0A4Y2MMM7_ARAVE|nr:hypothetical protein AVEN_215219-1 [Araneus ventricosus]
MRLAADNSCRTHFSVTRSIPNKNSPLLFVNKRLTQKKQVSPSSQRGGEGRVCDLLNEEKTKNKRGNGAAEESALNVGLTLALERVVYPLYLRPTTCHLHFGRKSALFLT